MVSQAGERSPVCVGFQSRRWVRILLVRRHSDVLVQGAVRHGKCCLKKRRSCNKFVGDKEWTTTNCDANTTERNR